MSRIAKWAFGCAATAIAVATIIQITACNAHRQMTGLQTSIGNDSERYEQGSRSPATQPPAFEQPRRSVSLVPQGRENESTRTSGTDADVQSGNASTTKNKERNFGQPHR